METNYLFKGDCREFLKTLPSHSIGLIATDIPYGMDYHSNLSSTFNIHSKIAGDTEIFFPYDELDRILIEEGAMFVFFAPHIPLGEWFLKQELKRLHRNIDAIRELNKDNPITTFSVIKSDIEKLSKFTTPIVNTIIWNKGKQTGGDLEGDFGRQYESIAFIPKSQFKVKGKRLSNLWDCTPTRNQFHPTEKPVELMKLIVQQCPKGYPVLDPCCGSGSTLVACAKLEIPYIGCEIDSKYYPTIEERLHAVHTQELLFGGTTL